MFTKEFIIEACNQRNREEQAETAWRNLKYLNLHTSEIEKQLDEVVNTAKEFNQKALDYMLEYLPKGLRDQLIINRISGAFASDTFGRYAFHTEFTVYLSEPFERKDQISFKFDHELKVLYHDVWSNNTLVSNYIQQVPKDFNAWIYISKKNN